MPILDSTCEPISSIGCLIQGACLMRSSRALMLVQSGSIENYGNTLKRLLEAIIHCIVAAW